MTGKRQQLVMVLHEVAQGQMTAVVAATVLGVSEQQVWRLLAAYRRAGAAALQHGNTGRPPAHTMSAAVRQRVVMLTTTTYQGCNEQHLSELLAEREGIVLSRSSLLRILHAEGIGAAHQVMPQAHRQRRSRYPRAGMLVQIHASPHDWIERRGPRLTLVAAIDDATNEVPAALFRVTEDAHGYFLLLERLVTTHGVRSPSTTTAMAFSSRTPIDRRAWRSSWPGRSPRPSSAACWPNWASPQSPRSRRRPKAAPSASSVPCKIGS